MRIASFEIWSGGTAVNNKSTDKYRKTQRRMEKSVIGLTLWNSIKNEKKRKQTGVRDLLEYTKIK